MRALNTAASGMTAQQLKIDVIANNLANVNTVGFKKSRIAFEDLYYQQVRDAGVASQEGGILPAGVQIGNGVRTVAVSKVFVDGGVEQTEQPLNLAIQGDGFFQVMNGAGETLYTRDGSFMKNADGEIVTPDGHRLQPGFTLPAETRGVVISQDGVVSVTLGNDPTPVGLGTLELARFVNPAGLEAVGQNAYRQTQASGEPSVGAPGGDGMGSVLQGHLETANVDVAQELVNMILAQRSYEVASKAITAADEMLSQANNLKR